MPSLVDGVELAGFLVVNVALLAVLVRAAVALASCLRMTGRTFPIFELKKKPRTSESTVQAGAQS